MASEKPADAESLNPKFRHRLEFLGIAAVSICLRMVPRGAHGLIANAVALLWFHAIPIRKKRVMENLEIAFAQKDTAWKKKIAIGCMRHFTLMSLEFSGSGKKKKQDLDEIVPQTEGLDEIQIYRKKTGEAFLGVTGHFGNWELLVSYFSLVLKMDIAAFAKRIHNPFVDRLVTENRKQQGFEVIHFSRNIRPALKALRHKKVLGFVADQDARRSGIFIPFFGKKAATFSGPAQLARHTNLPILPAFCHRVGWTHSYRLRAFPIIMPDMSLSKEEDIERMTRYCSEKLEEMIRDYPEQYLWFHRRWKTQPKKGRSKKPTGE
ncbi:MAG: lysophospholipid acyltransferase family protein [Candidatus Sumerlaeia bacterium]